MSCPAAPPKRPASAAANASSRSTACPFPSVSSDEAADMLKGLEGTPWKSPVTDAAGAMRRLRVVRRRVDVPSVQDCRGSSIASTGSATCG